MSKKTTVEAECDDCGATGVYCGFAEPKGTGVICMGCGGTGKVTLSYKPFIERKTRKGVKEVRASGGVFVATGVGPVGGSVSYIEFLGGAMPKAVRNRK